MKFEDIFSFKQSIDILFIIGSISLFTTKPENAYFILRFLALMMLLFSVLDFWQESGRRYKILVPYKKNRFDSKAEEKIAAYFVRKNIIFNHHPEIKIPKKVFGIFYPLFLTERIEPDFYLPEFDVYVEYWGLIDDPTYKKEQYDVKKKKYDENQLNLLSLYPKNMDNLDFTFTSKLLDIIKKNKGDKRKYR